jgi:hypothetical protein
MNEIESRRAAQQGGYPAFLADLSDDRRASVPFFGHPRGRTRKRPLPAPAACCLPDRRE